MVRKEFRKHKRSKVVQRNLRRTRHVVRHGFGDKRKVRGMDPKAGTPLVVNANELTPNVTMPNVEINAAR